jgi:hypothetical protein
MLPHQSSSKDLWGMAQILRIPGRDVKNFYSTPSLHNELWIYAVEKQKFVEKLWTADIN